MQASHAAGMSFEASFQLLAQAGLITIVSSPRMTVAVGQTGYLLAGQEIPIQTSNIVSGVLQMTTSYKPVGVQLFITPAAVGNKKIKLHTISVVSSVSGFTPLASITGQGLSQPVLNPVIDSREAETQVTVEDGNTLVISGLRMVKTMTREDKVPGLGDIPILGWLFKSQRSQQQSTDLYFFVTPTML
jgi:pilus assembly protein CpaC